ncbi:hypothetical protein F5B20DRAFT_586050 [Whalleya microplaca]|nr:hypothetical protein F5B20DRAFT_586050 [Whalleya microplaca]
MFGLGNLDEARQLQAEFSRAKPSRNRGRGRGRGGSAGVQRGANRNQPRRLEPMETGNRRGSGSGATGPYRRGTPSGAHNRSYTLGREDAAFSHSGYSPQARPSARVEPYGRSTQASADSTNPAVGQSPVLLDIWGDPLPTSTPSNAPVFPRAQETQNTTFQPTPTFSGFRSPQTTSMDQATPLEKIRMYNPFGAYNGQTFSRPMQRADVAMSDTTSTVNSQPRTRDTRRKGLADSIWNPANYPEQPEEEEELEEPYPDPMPVDEVVYERREATQPTGPVVYSGWVSGQGLGDSRWSY